MSTKIEWTDETWNPIRARNRETGGVGHFCVHKSPGCKHCYAEPMQRRLFNNPIRYAAQDANKVELFLDEKVALKPLSWRKPRRVFVCSMTDLFLENHPEEWILDVWVNMALAHTHTFQVLTKRPERMRAFVDKCRGEVEFLYEAVMEGVPVRQRREFQWPLPNVWLGVSIEGPAYWPRAVQLKETPAAVRFLSIEPLIEGLGTHVRIVDDMDWVIVGGESGPNARPMHPQWAREIRKQCRVARVPFFFKQWGNWFPDSQCWTGGRGFGSGMTDDEVQMTPDGKTYRGAPPNGARGEIMTPMSKKRAGRLLDGREWNEVPA